MGRPMLDLLGLGLSLPPSRKVRDLVREAGGDPEAHEGWDQVCIAGDADHPSTMAANALTAALNEAGVDASQLGLVLSVGVSRDYAPSWSLAAEVMRLHGAPDGCLGFDLTIGCLGFLAGLNTALGWLETMDGGYAAIVTAERWSHTVDRSNAASRAMWGHADGAGAMVVSLRRAGAPLATFGGAAFTSHAAYNGLILVKYGGTRFPITPPGESPFTRIISPIASSELWQTYEVGYTAAFAGLRERFGQEPGRLVCNQISPNIVSMIARVSGIGDEHICRTGHAYGHVGAADVVIGLRHLVDHHQLDRPIVMAASAPYAFGAGLVMPPVG